MLSTGPMTDISLIRNFAIIAHIDHGKSTLSDRLIQLCGNVPDREMKEQILDSMDIERERGITIKAQTVRLDYRAKDGKTYQLNLMDTPGHVDFAYEVSRSLAACEGAVLVVDASQGVEAQTLANVYQALDNNLEILPVLNKVDLAGADPDRVKQQIEEVIGLDASHAVPISAKTGKNVEAVLESIVERLPPPKGDAKAPLKALLIDSWYDAYLGVVVLVRVIDGALRKGQRIRLMASDGAYQVERVGIFRPKQEALDQLGPGEVGFFTAAIKQVADTRVGDTVTDEKKPTEKPLPGFKRAQPVVFCGLFPVDAAQFEDLREAMARLRLNDASFTYETESSAALGFGFRCGFLGLPAHLDHRVVEGVGPRADGRSSRKLRGQSYCPPPKLSKGRTVLAAVTESFVVVVTPVEVAVGPTSQIVASPLLAAARRAAFRRSAPTSLPFWAVRRSTTISLLSPMTSTTWARRNWSVAATEAPRRRAQGRR